MNRLKQGLAGIGFGICFLCLLALVDASTRPNLTPESRRDKWVAGIGLGLPAGAIASWLCLDLRRRTQQQRETKLQVAFFQLLAQQQGYLDLLSFVQQTGLPVPEAKAYLDQKAQAFMAEYEVSESGQIFYYFGKSNLSPSGQTGDDYPGPAQLRRTR